MDIKICRLCCKNEGSSYLFNESTQLSSKIMHCCAKVNIFEGDGLPSRICEACEEELTTAYKFVIKCETADLALRSHDVADCQASKLPSEDCKLKLEVKLESCGSDHEHYDDDPSASEFKLDAEVKPEVTSQTTRAKRPYKKRVKYKLSESLKCSICGRKCVCQSALIIHMRYHTNETPFQCQSCEKKYKDQGSLKRHVERNHSKGERERNYICENCGKGFFSKNDVKIHMRTHTGETPYVCSECPLRFTQISALLRHKKRHTGEKPHLCSMCTKRFCTKEELKHHLKVHTNEKKYSCSVCSVPFKYQNNLKKHMLLHSAPNSFVCNYCGRTFNQKGNLKSHIDRQHSEKSGYCNVCTKNVSNIEVHMWRHTGQRPLKCELCSSSFYELKSLARHVNYRHKNPDKFKCASEGCLMTFPSRSMLEFHTAKLHDNRILFPCDRCSRGFYRKNDLARHKIGTHKERLVE